MRRLQIFIESVLSAAKPSRYLDSTAHRTSVAVGLE
jgi:hypothetical protein